jgi:hypothetical protein
LVIYTTALLPAFINLIKRKPQTTGETKLDD